MTLNVGKHVLFNVGWMMAFTQYYEFCWRLWNNSLLKHTVLSSVGVHHGYWGFIIMYVAYFLLTIDDWRTVYKLRHKAFIII